MSPAASPAALVVHAPARLYRSQLAAPLVAGWSSRDAGLRQAFRRVLWVLGGFGEMIVVAYAFALAVLAIGIPIALLARLVAETGRALRHL
jgi:hypothetical protein